MMHSKVSGVEVEILRSRRLEYLEFMVEPSIDDEGMGVVDLTAELLKHGFDELARSTH